MANGQTGSERKSANGTGRNERELTEVLDFSLSTKKKVFKLLSEFIG